MQPNIDNTKDELLFRCECGSEYLEVYLENDGLWINSISYPKSLWQVLKWWFKHRKIWNFDVLLRNTDIKTLRDTLDEYIKRKNK